MRSEAKRRRAQQRAGELVRQMTLEEKAGQMLYQAPAIPRLGLPAYNWWNEALHGVARAGLATVFPQSIGLAATFDPALIEKIGRVIGEEGRLKNAIYRSEGERGIYKGLTYWSPNINIVRDPRWGRAHETYGEDPCLTAAMGTAFVRGMQEGEEGDGLTAAACVKHFAVHSGPEETRHGFDAEVTPQDLMDTYLPAFERVVKDAQVAGVMGAYNAVNGVPCCANAYLQQELLRREWGFEGYTVSDCGAISDISERHHYTATKVEAAALAVQNGCDLNCGAMYGYLLEAVQKGYLKEEAIDQAVQRLLTVRLMLDMDAPVADGKAAVQTWLTKQPEYEALNLRAAEKSMVLLKNNGILPLAHPKTVAVIGPNARSLTALEGNYHGTAEKMTTVLQGLREALPDSQFLVSEGCHLYKNKLEAMSQTPDDQLAEAVALARYAQVSVLCLGLDPSIEGELGDASNEYAAGDKHSLYLPESQQRLLKAVCRVSEQVVVVLLSGGALDLGEEEAHVGAVLQAWYPGAMGGKAAAEVLTGQVNPTGRLPVTFYHNEQVCWDFEDYAMTGKTYRYFKEKPLYPFGYGLSYRRLMLSEPQEEAEGISFSAYNPYDKETEMAVQVYAKLTEQGLRTANCQLVALQMLCLRPGERKRVHMPLPDYWMQVVDEKGKRRPCKGSAVIYIGDHQPDARSEELCEEPCLQLILKK
ncbi:MAG: glycoside hydrolase family 3 protein [Lachnospiraceae bacterium]|jgi:beta-glucosidase|nr:glycoside hydrolase family 3 protein [Lachnospiraceae bacterium]